jgi:plastocyanin
MRRITSTLFALAGLGLLAPTQAQAVGTPVIIAGPGGATVNYTQPVAVAQPGDDIDLIVVDIAPHDVVSIAKGPDTAPHCSEDSNPAPGTQRRFPLGHCPVFWSELVGAGTITPVRGLENIEPGEIYTFYCTIHSNMEGQLIAI